MREEKFVIYSRFLFQIQIYRTSIETLRPFLYFKQPRPYIQRKNKNPGNVERLACKMLEKALEWDLDQFDFDSVIKYARNDFLISGMGLAWEQYVPEFIEIAAPEKEANGGGADSAGGVWAIKTGEKVETVYLDPGNFICDCDKVGVWEDVEWIAKKIFMTRDRVLQTFGDTAQFLVKGGRGVGDGSREICVYEIWDKLSQKVYWLAKEVPFSFLRVVDNPLKLNGFFRVRNR